MDPDPVDILTRYPAPRHRLTRRDYHRLAEVGILAPDARVELLEGQVVDMSPAGPRHALVITSLNRLLVRAAADRTEVRCQLPIVLDDGSEPEPDFTLVRRPWDGFPHEHPGAADILLLVEVSDSSLNFDRTVKLPLYARAGVREVWIIDLTTDTVTVHRNPSGLKYETVLRPDAAGTLEVEALPGPQFSVSDLFA